MPERNGRTGGHAPVLLVVVLLLVMGAFGLLLVALVTGHDSWAWGSVAASAVAGVLLVTDWIARSKVPTAEPAGPVHQAAIDPVDPSAGGDTSRMAGRDTPRAPAVERMEASARRASVPEPGAPRRTPADPDPGRPVEPD